MDELVPFFGGFERSGPQNEFRVLLTEVENLSELLFHLERHMFAALPFGDLGLRHGNPLSEFPLIARQGFESKFNPSLARLHSYPPRKVNQCVNLVNYARIAEA